MKIKFKVHHTYGLACEEVFGLEQLGLESIPLEKLSKDNEELFEQVSPLLNDWVMKNYNHGDALPSWEIV